MSAALPEFPYHPDPIKTGWVRPSPTLCVGCGQARGFIYAGPVFAVEELDECLCPWCIADGTAASRFDATFTDDQPVPADVPASVVEVVTRRTPGFGGWQQEHWLYHCGDGAAFLGVVGWNELQEYPEALDDLRREAGAQPEPFLQALRADGSPAAYLFACRMCSKHLAYSDCD